MLRGSPTALELQKSLVFRFGSAEIKGFEPVFEEMFYGFPHDEIIRSQVLIMPVRGPVFIDGLVPEMKIDGTGDDMFPMGGQCDKAPILRQNMFMDLFEKTKRLGR